jgi:hypothetical protein
MTWPLWEAFREEWRLRPPVHWLVAGYIGYEPPPSLDRPALHPDKQYMTREAAMDWFAKTGGRIEGVRKM